MNPNFKGIYAVTVTPFKQDGSFDFDKAKKHLDWLIDCGVQGVCVLGATGEYQSVTLEEHKAFVKEIVPYIKDRVSVIVGATRERADDVIDLVNNIKACGAHAAMVLTPPYCHPSQDEIYENYRYIMEKTQFPLVVYNNPGSCGVSIERDTFQKLLELPYATIVKESSGSMQKLTEVLMDAPTAPACSAAATTWPLRALPTAPAAGSACWPTWPPRTAWSSLRRCMSRRIWPGAGRSISGCCPA